MYRSALLVSFTGQLYWPALLASFTGQLYWPALLVSYIGQQSRPVIATGKRGHPIAINPRALATVNRMATDRFDEAGIRRRQPMLSSWLR
jgi:hypothetical protein